MADHVEVVALDAAGIDPVIVEPADSADAAIAAAIAGCLVRHPAPGVLIAVVVMRNGCVERNVHGAELAGLRNAAAEATCSAVARWWEATKAR